MGQNISTNNLYGNALVDIGKKYKKLIVMDADISRASYTCLFKDSFQNRFINVGIAEQNMISIAAGLASMGYILIVNSLAKFISTRSLDQIINSVAYPNLNVNIVGIYSGLSIGKDGATHQCLEDIAIMRAIPNMTVICPGYNDEIETLLEQCIRIDGPVYIRLCEGLGKMTCSKEKLAIGKGIKITSGNDLTIVTTGVMTSIVYRALEEAELISKVELIYLHTLKPIDKYIIIESAEKNKKVLTFEDHNLLGGLGSIVSDILSERKDIIVKKYGINDSFGCSGTFLELIKKFSLSKEDIIDIIKRELLTE
ncbi:transketolase family protein [Sporanaerobacter acetigenes]|uniref:Transketolase n=1 Tax=Sporanaerobacter acetigenes DSM 13106 TaxID=1123281 RepID=A0A1M5Z8V9_9FIRM|nr:transketolase C-terminal domain-containing protein [Sporanaerobacter acetigenes]SHI20679.1 transketolase [Sporanaerobacter acetigenes DSM 13106]